MTGKGSPLNLLWPRRISQILFFFLWYFGFLRAFAAADKAFHDNILPDLFLRSDPLSGIVSSAASRGFGQEWMFWVPMVILAVLLGRLFCGWMCPMGTLLDASDRVFKAGPVQNRRETFRRFMNWKYGILVFLLGSALFSVSLSGHLDPLCIMTRAFSFSLHPALAELESRIFGSVYFSGYAFTERHFFEFNLFAGLLLTLFLFLNSRRRRFFCRVLCPLGALYGVFARFSFVRLYRGGDLCGGCHTCARTCKTGAIDFPAEHGGAEGYRKGECVLCYGCVDACPKKAARIRFSLPRDSSGGSDDVMPRRRVVQALLAGVVAAPLMNLDPVVRKGGACRLIRPPFARPDERLFLELCTRCGLCMQACKTNTLQPATLGSGLEALMTPVLVPQIAGCDGACTLCGEVCPTNAIVRFTQEEKHSVKMGSAVLELGRCIGWTQNKDCNECVKICPTQAIKVAEKDGVLKPVSLVNAECTGCGLCEKRCGEIILNGTACVTSSSGRGTPTDFNAIGKNIREKAKHGKDYMPRA